MTIYLIRHTEYENPENIFPFHLPVVLSEQGIAHAQRIGEWLVSRAQSQVSPALPIFSSPIKRTLQTSEIIAGYTKSQITTDERLIETINPGLQGKKKPEVNMEAWKLQYGDATRESAEHTQKRMIEIFDEKKLHGEDCILVSHGDPLTILYFYLMRTQLPDRIYESSLYIDKGEIVQVEILQDEKYDIERFTI